MADLKKKKKKRDIGYKKIQTRNQSFAYTVDIFRHLKCVFTILRAPYLLLNLTYTAVRIDNDREMK